MAEDPVLRVRVDARSIADLKAFVEATTPDLGCRPHVKRAGDGFSLEAFLPESQLAAARGVPALSTVNISTLEDMSETGRLRQQEVGSGNRFAARGVLPRGLGRKE